jgi:hypothetical protein
MNEMCTGRPTMDDFDAKGGAIWNNYFFESPHFISKTLDVAHSTIVLHLHDFIGFRLFHLQWGPHLLTHDLRGKPGGGICAGHVAVLLAAKRDDWHYFVTDDQSCCLLNISPHGRQTLSRDNVVIRPRLDIQGKKFMFVIIKNPRAFCVIDRLSHDIKNEHPLFCEKSTHSIWISYLSSKKNAISETTRRSSRELPVHISRGSTEWLEEHGMSGIPHSRHLSNRAFNDFYLFPTVKEKHEQIQMADKAMYRLLSVALTKD